jgi:hypothetical protein
MSGSPHFKVDGFRAGTGTGNDALVEGEYWLRRQQGAGHWAKVHVRIGPGAHQAVQVAPDACAWIAGLHGDRTATAVPEDLRAGAEAGARLALSEAGATGMVTVTEIQYTSIDTSAGDVRLATAWAVWQALGHQPRQAPYIDSEGIHFPPADS